MINVRMRGTALQLPRRIHGLVLLIKCKDNFVPYLQQFLEQTHNTRLDCALDGRVD